MNIPATRFRVLATFAAVSLIGFVSLYEPPIQAQSSDAETLANRCYRDAAVEIELDGIAAQEAAFARDFTDRVVVEEDFDPARCAWPYILDQPTIDPILPRSARHDRGSLSLRIQLVWRAHMRAAASNSVQDTRRFETLANAQWFAWVGLVWTGKLGGASR